MPGTPADLRMLRRLASLSLFWLASLTVCAAELGAHQHLRIETGTHTAAINRITTDRQGSFAVTVSDDKTARVWDVASGKLLNVLRVPIDAGDVGKLYAVALSPDTRTVAVAGWLANGDEHIFLLDRGDGRLLRRLGDLPDVVHDLAFSPDGRWLAAALGSDNGVRVFDMEPGGAVLADSDYDDSSYGLHFSADGRLVVSSDDGLLRLYRPTPGKLHKLAQVKAPGGGEPSGVAFSPDGQSLAVGYSDTPRVDVLDGQTLALLHSPDVAGVRSGQLNRVAWSADGRTLFAAGSWDRGDRHPVRCWPNAGRGRAQDVDTLGNTVMSLAPLAGGGVLVSGADAAWGVLAASGEWQRRSRAPLADLRGSLGAHGFAIAADGRTVQFGFDAMGGLPHRFRLSDRSLLPGKDVQLLPPRIRGLDVRQWEDGEGPTLDGKPLALWGDETSRSLAITPERRGFVLGTDWWLRHFDAGGQSLWKRPVPEVAWGVHVTPDAKLVVAAYGDGTIRWHRLSDGRELLAFFPHADRKRWVLWTPSGYFDASPDAEGLIGWHINRGADRAPEFRPLSRLREQFHRPDVVDAVLDTLDESLALRRADGARQGAPAAPARQ